MEPQPPRRTTHITNSPKNLLVYDRWGAFGRPIVLLHGLLFDRTMWWPLAAELATGCTVIAPDLPGHGESPPRADYSCERVARDLATLIHGLDLHRAPIVVAHSTSAPLAITFADAYACHHVLAVDQPTGAVEATVDGLIAAAHLDDVPGTYRPYAEPRRDPALLQAYESWLAEPPTRRIARVGLATAGSAASRPRGRETSFAHLCDPAEFAVALRALL